MIRSLAIAAALVCVAQASHAQEQQSFKSILGKGYEIKSVTFARGESTENREIFLIKTTDFDIDRFQHHQAGRGYARQVVQQQCTSEMAMVVARAL